MILDQFLKMAGNKQKLPAGWEKDYFAHLRESWEKQVEAGTIEPIKLQFFDCEMLGNPCPVCGISPLEINQELIISGFKLGEYKRYTLECDCETLQDCHELNRRETEKRISAAEIPENFKSITWNDWDNTIDPGITRVFQKVKNFSNDIESFLGKGLILMGSVGRGKTMTGICLLKLILINTKKKCKFIPMADFTQNIIRSGKDGRYIDDIINYDVLFLDDIDKLSAASLWVQERVFSLFDNMFRENKTLIVTTNKTGFQELADYFGENGEAITSRMIDKMEFARFEGGEDYRKLRRVRQNKSCSI